MSNINLCNQASAGEQDEGSVRSINLRVKGPKCVLQRRPEGDGVAATSQVAAS